MSRTVSRFLHAFLVGLLALATVAVLVPSAHAEPGQRKRLNMWQDGSYEGHKESRLEYDTDLHNDSCAGCDFGPGGDFGDDMSSFVNKTRSWWIIYVNKEYDTSDRNGIGDWPMAYCIRPRSHDADLGNNDTEGGELEDEISSVKRQPSYGYGVSNRPTLCGSRYPILGHKN